jgi:antirestriction protein ArdC
MSTAPRPNKATEAMAAVVDQLVTLIEEGSAGTWSMPWQQISADQWNPTNARTGNTYTGGNRLALAMTAMLAGYSSGTWATYRQWADLGGQVRKGEKAVARIVRPIERTIDDTDEDHADEGTPKRSRIFWKASAVFHADQVDGWTPTAVAVDDRPPIDQAEALVSGWTAAGMNLVELGNRAFYSPASDFVHVPPRSQFPHLEHWYSTTFHEGTHWTAKRLGRQLGGRFGDHAYAVEELVAELGAAMLGAHVGIDQVARPDHVDYLAHWLQVLKADPHHLWTVASHAEKAAAFLVDLAEAPARQAAA